MASQKSKLGTRQSSSLHHAATRRGSVWREAKFEPGINIDRRADDNMRCRKKTSNAQRPTFNSWEDDARFFIRC